MTRGGSGSFACTSGGVWQWFTEDGVNVPIAEMRAEIERVDNEHGANAAADLRALFAEKLRQAQRGTLQPPADIKTQLFIRPGVMEIRWSVGRGHWRLYFCEPPRLAAQRVMLGLRFNRKISLEAQDADITEAAHRWSCWQAQHQD